MPHVESFVQDLRYAARGFFRTPVFSLTAIFAVALGVGAGTAVFSVVDRILFRSLPYPDSGRLVSFGMVAPIVPQEFMLGYDYLDWRDSQKPFETLGSWMGARDCDLNDTNPVRLRCTAVDPYLLPTLGIQPLRGRNFTPEEDKPTAPKVALISYGLWKSRFAGDSGIVGKAVPLDGKPATVLGVLPAQFELPTLAQTDVLVPQALDEAEQRSRRNATVLWTVARLKPGVSLAQARAALQPSFEKSLESVSPEFRKDIKLRLRSLHDRQIEDARTASWVLLASVLAVLLIACANVANLLLARSAVRQRELVVRAALGAGRGRLIRQVLTESVLLAFIGGAAGCALAFGLLRVFVAIAPEGIPRLSQASVDLRVLLFTMAMTLVSGVLFGLAPALQTPQAEALTGVRTLGARHQPFRQALVAAQICISLVLLTGASLLLRSLWNLENQPLGVRADNVVTAEVTLGANSYSEPARQAAFFEGLEEHLRQIPGVAELALSDSVPPGDNPNSSILYNGIDVQGRPRATDGTGGRVASRTVTPRYFAALGIPILRGRPFRDDDRDPKQNTVILSDSLARRMFPGEDAIGKQIKPGRIGPWLSVIGVAGDVKNSGLVARGDPECYFARKNGPEGAGRIAVAIIRSAMPPQAVARWVRSQVAALDPTLPVKTETMERNLSRLAARPRFNAVLLAIFAGMGLLLAAIGLYGVMSFLVAQRTREIGVRIALGATPGAITRLVLARAGVWTAAGAVLGLIGSIMAASALRSVLFNVSARDPWAPAAALIILIGVALLAAWVPSRRAAQVDPMQALRQE